MNQFRCETMKMTNIKLTLPGIMAQRFIEHNQDLLNPEQQEKIRDYAASVNTGTSGRFEEEIFLDTVSVKQLQEKNKYFTVEATFSEDGNGFIIQAYKMPSHSFFYFII